MAKKITREFLAKIPKTDLHLHLDGSLRLSTLIELAKAAKVPLPSETEAGLQELVFKEKYKDLPDYLQGFDRPAPCCKRRKIWSGGLRARADNIAEKRSLHRSALRPATAHCAPASAWRKWWPV